MSLIEADRDAIRDVLREYLQTDRATAMICRVLKEKTTPPALCHP